MYSFYDYNNPNNSSIQFISDIHLEFYKNNEIFNIIPHSPNLALCGDIGYPNHENYRNFIIRCSQLFKNVFVIFGNHEFYNSKYNIQENGSIQTINDRKSIMKNFPHNVYFLDNTAIYLDTITNNVYSIDDINSKSINFKPYTKNFVKIIGSTLWSDIDYYTASKMNDVNFIFIDNKTRLDYKYIKTMYYNNINWILNEIKSEPNIACILLTHHAVHPIFLNKEYINNPRINLKNAYVNWIPELYKNRNLIACICGHTHNQLNIKLDFSGNSIHFLSNPVGYKHEQPNYDANKKWSSVFIFNEKF